MVVRVAARSPSTACRRRRCSPGWSGLQADDVRWRDGRAFTLAYSAGPDVLAVAEEAYRGS